MENEGDFGISTYRTSFGSWSEALQEAGLDVNSVWYPDHLDHLVRSRWEADIADLLLDAGVDYEYESIEISYGENRTYTPDFVTDTHIIEVKGHIYENKKVIKKAQAAMRNLDESEYVVVGKAIPADIHIPWKNRNQIVELFD
jgi:hypothetical protein